MFALRVKLRLPPRLGDIIPCHQWYLLDNSICIAVSYDQYSKMFFKVTTTSGQPLYVQLVQQIRHATECGALRHGDQLPGIRTLAEELTVSPNTVAKAYSELEHEGILELRQGSGAFICLSRRARSVMDHVEGARHRAGKLIDELRGEGLRDDEIRRVFEAELLRTAEVIVRR